MSAAGSLAPVPVALRKEGTDKLLIDWNDGVQTVLTWRQLRDACPCASCREDRTRPADPFRILKPQDLLPLAPVQMTAVGRYAYKIVWSDGHDTGIFTLEFLRQLGNAASGQNNI
jgi:DUF971 family protein